MPLRRPRERCFSIFHVLAFAQMSGSHQSNQALEGRPKRIIFEIFASDSDYYYHGAPLALILRCKEVLRLLLCYSTLLRRSPEYSLL